MKNKNLVFVLIFGLFFWIFACAGNRKANYGNDIDLSWAGTWKGQALVVNSLDPPKSMELDIVFSGSGITAFLTDSSQNLIRHTIRELVFEDESIIFKASYETIRSLQRNIVFRGIKLGPYLKIEFSGSEGGRAFTGKWQAKRVTTPSSQPATPAADTTSTASL
jgi:hypothetical protein